MIMYLGKALLSGFISILKYYKSYLGINGKDDPLSFVIIIYLFVVYFISIIVQMLF